MQLPETQVVIVVQSGAYYDYEVLESQSKGGVGNPEGQYGIRPQNHTIYGFFSPNSIMVLYLDFLENLRPSRLLGVPQSSHQMPGSALGTPLPRRPSLKVILGLQVHK